MAFDLMNDGVAYRLKSKVKAEVKNARLALQRAKQRQEEALRRMVRDKNQLRATAKFVRRQEGQLASKIQVLRVHEAFSY
jgi:hypothetical protein